MAKKKSTPVENANSLGKEQTSANNAAPANVPEPKVELKAAEAKPLLTPETKTAPRMFEVRKADSRKNILPINLESEIRRRAYELYQRRGTSGGSEADDWLSAEREVMERYHQQSA